VSSYAGSSEFLILTNSYLGAVLGNLAGVMSMKLAAKASISAERNTSRVGMFGK